MERLREEQVEEEAARLRRSGLAGQAAVGGRRLEAHCGPVIQVCDRRRIHMHVA